MQWLLGLPMIVSLTCDIESFPKSNQLTSSQLHGKSQLIYEMNKRSLYRRTTLTCTYDLSYLMVFSGPCWRWPFPLCWIPLWLPLAATWYCCSLSSRPSTSRARSGLIRTGKPTQIQAREKQSSRLVLTQNLNVQFEQYIKILSAKSSTLKTRTDEPTSVMTRCVWLPACVHVCAAFDWVEKYAPGFKKSVVGRDVLTPPDLERIFGLTGGVRTLRTFKCQHRVSLTHAIVHQTRKSFASSRRYAAPLHTLLIVTDGFYNHRPKGRVQVLVDCVKWHLKCFFSLLLHHAVAQEISTFLPSLSKWETEYSYPLSFNRIYSTDRCHSTSCT